MVLIHMADSGLWIIKWSAYLSIFEKKILKNRDCLKIDIGS